MKMLKLIYDRFAETEITHENSMKALGLNKELQC